MTRTMRLSTVTLVSLMIVGCSSESERVAQIATEAADRQAQQNQEMASLNHQVAEATKRLVEADAESRRDLVEVHQQLQSERTDLNEQWNALEAQRQAIARERRTASMLLPVAQTMGVVALAVVVIGFCWSLLFGLQRQATTDAQLAELLIHEMVSEQPLLLPLPSRPCAIADQRATDVTDTRRTSGDSNNPSNPEEDSA